MSKRVAVLHGNRGDFWFPPSLLSMDAGTSLPGEKATATWRWIWCRESVELYLHSACASSSTGRPLPLSLRSAKLVFFSKWKWVPECGPIRRLQCRCKACGGPAVTWNPTGLSAAGRASSRPPCSNAILSGCLLSVSGMRFTPRTK